MIHHGSTPPRPFVRSAVVAVAIATALTIAPREALADDASEQDGVRERDTPKSKRWYGWQTVAIDGAALGMTIVGVSNNTSALTTIGLGTYALGPPIVHMAHGRVGTGFASFGIRVLAPVAGAAVGFGVGFVGGVVLTGEPLVSIIFGAFGFVAGGAVGYLGAVLADAGGLAFEEPETKSQARQRPSGGLKLHLRPTFAIAPGNTSMGVAGTF